MRWVEQETSNTTDGDCFRACLASITELDDIPNYAADEHWFLLADEWLHQHGLSLLTKPPTWRPGRAAGPCVAVVRSPLFKGYDHAVVWYRDCAIWDPSPNRNERGRDLTTPKYFVVVERWPHPSPRYGA